MEEPPGTEALRLLSPNPDRIEPITNKIYGAVAGGLTGFAMAVYRNHMQSVPLYSGIHRHIMYTLAVGGVVHYLYSKREGYFAEREAVFRHYVQLHPEDFPNTERKKYSEVMIPWYPIR